jgi:hypothetical protein
MEMRPRQVIISFLRTVYFYLRDFVCESVIILVNYGLFLFFINMDKSYELWKRVHDK